MYWNAIAVMNQFVRSLNIRMKSFQVCCYGQCELIVCITSYMRRSRIFQFQMLMYDVNKNEGCQLKGNSMSIQSIM